MARPPPLALQDTPTPEHSDWQVVLSDPSKRRVVLYSRNLNRLSIEPTPPSSPRTTSRTTQARSDARRRSWSGLSSVTASDAASEAGSPSSSRASSPLGAGTIRRTAAGSARQRGDTDEDQGRDDDGSATSTRTIGGLADAVPESVCPLCFQILPPGPETSARRTHAPRPRPRRRLFPLLPPPTGFLPDPARGDLSRTNDTGRHEAGELGGTSYFELLSEANSLANTPTSTGASARIPRVEQVEPPDRSGGGKAKGDGLDSQQMNEGYYARFFDEVSLLGRGGQGAVYLVRHMLNGEALGLYACKKVPVGDSTPSLLSILREVHMLESASHPNIVAYHHAWLETASPINSRFVPKVPTLHILMEFANGGSLQSFIDARKGSPTTPDEGDLLDGHGAAYAARKRRKEAHARAVHLLRLEDVLTLFEQVVRGLAFLHGRNILHLDLKAENVLLHWDEDSLLPTCKLSDFGSASSDSYHRERLGGSGTLAYTPPEAFFPSPSTGHLPAPDRSNDMWALGLLLHLLVFFALPFVEAGSEGDNFKLEEEIKRYPGFFATDPLPRTASARHDLPPSLLQLLSQLIHRDPACRPSCERILARLPAIRQDIAQGFHAEPGVGTLTRASSAAPASSAWKQLLMRRKSRRSMSDGSIEPWRASNITSDFETEVIEVQDSDADDIGGSQAVEPARDESMRSYQMQRFAPVAPLPRSDLPRSLNVSPPARALPRAPSPSSANSPPLLALPSPTDIPTDITFAGPGPSAESDGPVRDSFALPWRKEPRTAVSAVLGDRRSRSIALSALAALCKLSYGSHIPDPTTNVLAPSVASEGLVASGRIVPLWLVTLLLIETAVDASLSRPSFTLLLLVAHFMAMRMIRILL